MDADKAAEVAARLPDAFVKAVLAQMSADDAAEIMSVMPVKTTARLIAPPTEPPQTRKRAAAAR
jgi:flagellar motility protein MotE (MotC chaperone)